MERHSFRGKLAMLAGAGLVVATTAVGCGPGRNRLSPTEAPPTPPSTTIPTRTPSPTPASCQGGYGIGDKAGTMRDYDIRNGYVGQYPIEPDKDGNSRQLIIYCGTNPGGQPTGMQVMTILRNGDPVEATSTPPSRGNGMAPRGR